MVTLRVYGFQKEVCVWKTMTTTPLPATTIISDTYRPLANPRSWPPFSLSPILLIAPTGPMPLGSNAIRHDACLQCVILLWQLRTVSPQPLWTPHTSNMLDLVASPAHGGRIRFGTALGCGNKIEIEHLEERSGVAPRVFLGIQMNINDLLMCVYIVPIFDVSC